MDRRLRSRLRTSGCGCVGRFDYGESYLSNPEALPLNPVALALRKQIFSTTLSSGFFGVMLDLAAACGISVPAHDIRHIHGQDVLPVEGFVSASVINIGRMENAITRFRRHQLPTPAPTYGR
jgi:hypothetical protein